MVMHHDSDGWNYKFGLVIVTSVMIITIFVSTYRSYNDAGGGVDFELKTTKSVIKTSVFYSPSITLQPGSVANKPHYINFPKGHIALKSFDAELVDEEGNPVPLHETYLHHWIVNRHYQPIMGRNISITKTKRISGRNAGVCPYNILGQHFGLGPETRRTRTWVPDPYGIEIGNPGEIPDGYDEKWVMNVHAIDTRGVVDKLGCRECKCDLYNVTTDEFGRRIEKSYAGGLFCCYDGTRCKLRPKDSKEDRSRKVYMKYTVRWMEWEKSIVPVKIYIFDVTYEMKSANGLPSCKAEYEIKSCDRQGRNTTTTTTTNDDDDGDCSTDDTKRSRTAMPHGGDLIYAVGHQHSGGNGIALYGQDGRVLCKSIPTYGNGTEAGNEAGYILGMSTCYPTPGSVRIADEEILTIESNYTRSQSHTGVMGFFYIYMARPQLNHL